MHVRPNQNACQGRSGRLARSDLACSCIGQKRDGNKVVYEPDDLP